MKPAPQALLWITLLVALALAVALSLFTGSRAISWEAVRDTLLGLRHDSDSIIIMQSRLPRTLLGLLVGAALGLSGALIQALTRNPLADTGLLGIQSGASFALVLAISVFGISDIQAQALWAFMGAMLTTLLVYLIGVQGGSRVDPVRFVLAGVALGALLTGLATGLTLLNPAAFDRLRFWHAGTLDIRDLARTLQLAPILLTGILLTLPLARPLNAMALGEDLAIALGTRTTLIRAATIFLITLLCATATATVGPIGFVGLMIPQFARWIVGPDLRRILPFSMLAAPLLLLMSDVAGRLLVPGELRVSIVTAFIGAPLLIWLARRHA